MRPPSLKPSSLFTIAPSLSAAILPVVSLIGCSVSSPGAVLQPSPIAVDPLELDLRDARRGSISPDVKRESEALHHFLGGHLALAADEPKEALLHFSEVDRLSKEPSPLVHGRLAELYVREGRMEEALAAAGKAIEESPDDPSMELLYAGILDSMGRTEEAIPRYRSVIERYPAKFEALILLANTYVKQGQIDEATALLEELVQRDPQGSIGHFYLGQVYEQQQRYEPAEREYLKVFEGDETLSRASTELLRVVLHQRKIPEARNLCERILQKNPQHLIARRVLGHLMLSESNLDGALQHLTVLEGLEQDSSDTRFKIALIHIEKRNFKEAERELILVVRKRPDHHEARYYLGSVYGATDRRDEAVQELLNIPQQSELYARSRTLAATLLRQAGDMPRARSVMQEVYAREPRNQNVVLAYALLVRDMGELDEARRLLEESLKDGKEDEGVLMTLGLVLHEGGRTAEAAQVMERVLARNPNNVDALNYVAYSLAEANQDLARAEDLAQRAVTLRNGDGMVLDTLGWVQYRRGKIAEAATTLRTAVALSGNDMVVIEHYSSALLAQGERVQAVAIIKGALQGPRDSKHDGDKGEGAAARVRLTESLREVLRQSPELAGVQGEVVNPVGGAIVEKVSTGRDVAPRTK